jgi:hypothetical protein
MSGEFPRPPLSVPMPAGSTPRDSQALAIGFLALIACFDVCLVSGMPAQSLLRGWDLVSLACLVMQTFFLSLLVRSFVPSPVVASLLWVGNFLLVNGVIATYSARSTTHYGFGSAFLAGQLAFLVIWLFLGTQSLGWRVLVACAGGGFLIVGWYGYAARRSTADWNLVWMSETIAVAIAAVLLKTAGFGIRYFGEGEKGPTFPVENGGTDGEGQFRLWHLMAGLFVVSCLLGLARLLGVTKPTYFADLAANEINAQDFRRCVGIGLAAALAVAFAAHCVLLRTHFAARYLPAFIYAAAISYAIHVWGPPHVDASVVYRKALAAPSRLGWIPTTSQWPFWMLFNAGMAMGGTMFLHALGYRLTRNQPAARDATNAR